jgi:glutamine amidotransferase
MAVAVSDGRRIIIVRYSSERNSRSLFYSATVQAIKARFPEDERIQNLSEETRIVVSEPLGEESDLWKEVPESSVGIVQLGQDELLPFAPRR